MKACARERHGARLVHVLAYTVGIPWVRALEFAAG